MFLGAIDTNKVLPEGSVQDVRDEVKRRIEDLGPSGYILAAVHDIQADVPPKTLLKCISMLKALSFNVRMHGRAVQRSETTSQDAWASSAAKRNDQPSFKKREIFTSRFFCSQL